MRHVAHAAARGQVGRIDRLAQKERFARRRGQQTREHLHRRGLSAPVRPQKSEDLAPLDAEAHAIDGGEIAKAKCQVPRRDDGLLIIQLARRNSEFALSASS